MKQRQAAARYARALFEVAKQRNETDIVGHELSVLVTMWRQSADLREFFVRPSLPRNARREAAVEIGQRCGLSKLAVDFFALIAEQGRASHITLMAEKFEKLVDADLRRVRVHVRSASRLTEDERERLRARLAKTLHAETVEMDETVDPALLGGFVVENDTLLLDGSLSGQLQAIRSRLQSGVM